MSEEINQEEKVEKMIDDLVKRAKIASEEYLKLDQKTVNIIIHDKDENFKVDYNNEEYSYRT